MQSLKPRPGKRRQQEVVQEKGSADTKIDYFVVSKPSIQHEDQVEEQEGKAELDQDLGRNIAEQFSKKTDS